MHRSQLSFALTALSAVALLVACGGSLAGEDRTCGTLDCAAGDKATTSASRADPYTACPSRGLSDYTNFVLGMLVVSKQMTGQIPNISPVTGDIEYRDGKGGPNATRLMQDRLRAAAGVQTLDEAMSVCSQGKNGLRVTIMNIRDDEGSAWVQVDKTKSTFWMPKVFLDKR